MAILACDPAVSVARLARENGLNANLLFRWRNKYREGNLGPLEPEHLAQREADRFPDAAQAPERGSKVAKKNRYFTPEFKRQTAIQACAPGALIRTIAQEHELDYMLLYRWRQEYLAGKFGFIEPGTDHPDVQRYPEDLKRRLAVEASEPGAKVVEVAREHGVSKKSLARWRKQYQAGLLNNAPDSPRLLPVTIGSESASERPAPSAAPHLSGGWIEILLGPATLRVHGEVSHAALAVVLACLKETT